MEKGVGDQVSDQAPVSWRPPGLETWPTDSLPQWRPASLEQLVPRVRKAKTKQDTGPSRVFSLLLCLGWRLSGKEGLPCKEQEQRGTGHCSCPLGLCLRQSRGKQAPDRPGAAAERVFREPGTRSLPVTLASWGGKLRPLQLSELSPKQSEMVPVCCHSLLPGRNGC